MYYTNSNQKKAVLVMLISCKVGIKGKKLGRKINNDKKVNSPRRHNYANVYAAINRASKNKN